MTEAPEPRAASGEEAIRALRERGFSQHESGDVQAAERSYREVLQRVPDDFDIVHALGVLAVQTGRYGEAVELIRRVVRARASAAAYSDLGNALCGASRLEEAIRCYDQALALQADLAWVHLNRGHALQGLGRRGEALASYDRAIATWRQFYEAHVSRADLLRELARPEEALASYDQAIALRADQPGIFLKRASTLAQLDRWEDVLGSVDRAILFGADSAEARTLRGLSQAGLGRPEEAMESYEQAIGLDPAYVPAYVNRGILLRARAQLDEALASYDAALALRADSFEALSNRAAVLTELNRFTEALRDSDRAAALRPERLDIHLHRAAALTGLDRLEEAVECYDRVIAACPDHAGAYAGRAAALQYLLRHAEALSSAERAIALAPGLTAGHFNRAAALRDLLRLDEAVRGFETARSLQPEDPTTNCNLGGLLLLQGRFDLGWALYEWRSQLPGASRIHRYSQPRWQGEEGIRGKTLFVYLDQGLGDTIQFSRYAKLAERRGARVVMSVQNSLRRLLSSLSPTIQVLSEAQAPEAFDCHCPLASLPGAFKTRLETIPAAVPYLSAEPERVALWGQKLGKDGFKIGVCWQGNTMRSGIGRSFPLDALRPLSAIPGLRLISLQRDAGVEQLATLRAGMQVETLGEEFDAGPDAFLDTAAVMQHLDLVITCDTSVAHLAGALGRPAWVVLKRVPDWRWMLDRGDNPWYPTLRLFRQATDGQWGDVFDAIHRELQQRVPTWH